MLNVMRDNLRATWLRAIIWIVAASFVVTIFAVWGGAGSSGGAQGELWLAEVDDRTVLLGEFQQAVQNLEGRYRSFGGTLDAQTRVRLRQGTLDDLIDRALILQAAEDWGLAVTDGEVSRTVQEIFQENGQFIGRDAYLERLKRARMAPSSFEGSLREDLLTAKWSDAVRDSIQVSWAEVEDNYRRNRERTTIEYVLLDAQGYLDEVEVDDAGLEAYFGDHRDDYQRPEQRVASYVLLDRESIRDEVEVTDEQIEGYYRDNLETRYTTPAQRQASHILLRIDDPAQELAVIDQANEVYQRAAGGESFFDLAAEVSADERTAGNGGDLGWLPRGRMPAEFDAQLFSMTVGEISEPVRTSSGLHIIQLVDVREETVRTLDEARTEITNRLRVNETQRLLNERSEELAAKVASGQSLEQAAGQAGLEVLQAEAVAEDGTLDVLGTSRAAIDALFDLEPGDSTETALNVGKGKVVLRCDEVQPPADRELDEVRESVIEDYRGFLASERARTELEQGHAALADDEGLAELAESIGAEVQSPAAFLRAGVIPGLGREGNVVETAFETEVGTLSAPVETSQGWLVMEVKDRLGYDPDEYAEQRDTERDNLVRIEAQRLEQALLAEMRSAASISTNEPLVAQLMTIN